MEEIIKNETVVLPEEDSVAEAGAEAETETAETEAAEASSAAAPDGQETDAPALPELTAEELRLISMLDSGVHSTQELSAKPTNGEFKRYRRLGVGAVDAFRLANFDGIVSAAAAAARQTVLNSLAGKAHHIPTVAHGSCSASVPAEILSEYKALLPDASEREILNHYNRYLRKER